MKIIVIKECVHERVIGSTIFDIPTLINFLIEKEELNDNFWIFRPEADLVYYYETVPLCAIFPNWREDFLTMSFDEITHIFRGAYCFKIFDVYGA